MKTPNRCPNCGFDVIGTECKVCHYTLKSGGLFAKKENQLQTFHDVKQAERIVTELEAKVKAEAVAKSSRLITDAQQKADQIILEAEETATELTTKVRSEVDAKSAKLIADAQQKAEQIIKEAENTGKELIDKAESEAGDKWVTIVNQATDITRTLALIGDADQAKPGSKKDPRKHSGIQK